MGTDSGKGLSGAVARRHFKVRSGLLDTSEALEGSKNDIPVMRGGGSERKGGKGLLAETRSQPKNMLYGKPYICRVPTREGFCLLVGFLQIYPFLRKSLRQQQAIFNKLSHRFD